MNNRSDIIIRPLLTEKMSRLEESQMERLYGLEEYAKDVVMDLDQIIGNGLTVRTGPILIGELENPTTTQNMMKTV